MSHVSCRKSRGATHTHNWFFKSNACTHTSRTKKKNDTLNIHSAGSQPRWGMVGVACGAKRARHIWASASVAVPRRNALSFFLPREPAPRHATHTRPLSTHCSALCPASGLRLLCVNCRHRGWASYGPLWTSGSGSGRPMSVGGSESRVKLSSMAWHDDDCRRMYVFLVPKPSPACCVLYDLSLADVCVRVTRTL